jgi:hypothetical protein
MQITQAIYEMEPEVLNYETCYENISLQPGIYMTALCSVNWDDVAQTLCKIWHVTDATRETMFKMNALPKNAIPNPPLTHLKR